MNRQEFLSSLRNLGITLGLDQDNDLDVEAPEGILTTEIIQQIRQRKEELTAYLKDIKEENADGQQITVAAPAAAYPLSSAQMRLWLVDQINRGSSAYHISNTVDIKSAFVPQHYEAAIKAVIERHEILRTSFRENEEGVVKQHILPVNEVQFSLPYYDLSEDEQGETKAKDLIMADRKLPFDLHLAPLFRLILFRLNHEHYLLYFNMHHIIGDGWSMNVLASDIMHYYDAFCKNIPLQLAPLDIQYKDYAVWQQARLQSGKYNGYRAYWLEQFSGKLPLLDLPMAATRPAVITDKGYAYTIKFEKEQADGLRRICAQQQATLFMGMLAVLKTLFYRYTGKEDIIIGTSIAGREQGNLQQQIGFYINTLPLRTRFSGKDTFAQLLTNIKQVTLDAYQRQHYPFDQLAEELKLKRDLSRSPLFDVMVILHNEKTADTIAADMHAALTDNGPHAVKFDLNIDIEESEGAIFLRLAFNTDIYDQESMLRLLQHYRNIVTFLVKNQSTIPLNKINYLDTREEVALLETFNQTTTVYPLDKQVTALFAAQAALTPGQTALITDHKQYTYYELDVASNRLARHLYKKGVTPGTLVPVCMSPSAGLVTAILAILKAGGTYVPIDAGNAPSRIAHVLEETAAPVILTDNSVQLDVPKGSLVLNTDIFAAAIMEEAADAVNVRETETLFCVIYTSGSTGNPKGVMVRETSVLNRLYWMWEQYPFEAGECNALKTSVGFVDHIWELFGPLLKGIPSVIFTKEELLDTAQFIRRLSEMNVTRLVLVPSLLKAMLQLLEGMDRSVLEKLTYWTSSGEILSADLVHDFYSLFPEHRLLNIYGSSEIMGDGTCYDTAPAFARREADTFTAPVFDLSIREDVSSLIDEFNNRTEIIKTVSKNYTAQNFYDVSIDKAWTPEEYISFLRNDLLPNIVNVSSPNYVGHMTSRVPEFIKDLSVLMTELNQNLVKIDTSFAGSSIERQVIGMMHKVVYRMRYTFYRKHTQHARYSLGVVTNGGTMSNITALSYAMNKALPASEDFGGVVQDGIVKALAHYGYSGVVVISSKLAHYSVNKAMRTLGLGISNSIKLHFDKKDPEQDRERLIRLVEDLRRKNILILAIIGVAGATETGSIDRLEDLADVAEKYNIHFHADAAFGGALLFSKELSKKLKGIHRADTVTICGHKQMYLPMGASICLFKSPDFASWSENNTFYQARKGSYDLGRFSIEGSRSFVSLLFHGALKLLGAKGFSDLMEVNYSKTLLFAEKIRARDNFEIITAPEMNILTYRFIPALLKEKAAAGKLLPEELMYVNEINRKLQKLQFTNGKYFVSFTELELKNPAAGLDLERVVVLRAVIMNPGTTAQDFDTLLEEQDVIATQVQQGSPFAMERLLLSDNLNLFTDKGGTIVPIGKPIANFRIYILDNQLSLLPIGIPGEICVSGAGVSAGYLRRDDLTAERFIPHPFIEGEILYKTGDQGKWLTDGNIAYLGRNDDQLKIRGNRVEPGEIEQVLLQLDGIEQAVVTACTGSDEEIYLVAYCISSEPLQVTLLRRQLAAYLPDYMVPSFFIQMEEFPKTGSGKIDKKQLPAPEVVSEITYVAPRYPLEQKMSVIWNELFKREQPVGVEDDFFSIGGHSLRVMQLSNLYHRAFGVKLSVQELFTYTTIASQAILISGRSVVMTHIIPAIPEAADYAVSDGQYRLWLLSRQPEASRAYHLSGQISIEGPQCREQMERAITAVIARHEILRTVFHENEAGELRQIVKAPYLPVFTYDAINNEKDFDLAAGPLLRCGFVQTAPDKYIFHYTMHHIISDGWSLEVLRREVTALLNNATLPPLQLQYKDYAAWQKKGSASVHKEYWIQQLSGELPVLVLPSWKNRPAVKTYNGYKLSTRITQHATTALNSLCLQNGCTLFMGLMAVLKTLLYRYTGLEDIIVGTSTAGRELAVLDDQIGFYINALALRTKFDRKLSFSALLKNIREVTLAAYEHQLYPFDSLVEDLQLKGDPSRSPLFDIMLILHNEREKGTASVLQETVITERGNTAAKFDYLFYFTELEGGMDMSVEFNTDIYDKAMVAAMMKHFIHLLDAVVQNPETGLNKLEYIPAAEKVRLLTGAAGKPSQLTILDLFSNTINRYRDRIALSYEDVRITYGELDIISGKVAEVLRSGYNVQTNDFVTLQLERDHWTVPVILGILKCGAAYIPVDSSYPPERLAVIAKDSNSKLVINSQVLKEIITLSETAVVLPVVTPDPESTAYVIYTSGSTGVPKGVMISHANLYHYLQHCLDTYFTGDEIYKVPLFTSLSFDLTVTSLLGTLIAGGTLFIYAEKLESPDIIEDIFFVNKDINLLKCTPGHLQLLGDGITAVKQLIVGGEELRWPEILQVHRLGDIVIYNEYGPTETTVGCTVERISRGYTEERISIGFPIDNTYARVLDVDGNLQPAGVQGELCIGGAGVGKGYLNRVALTAEKFIADPYNAGQRLYKTGDLARWLPDGRLDYMGRADNQVKIRGYRVEQGEIEQQLLQIPGIKAAVVNISGTGTDKTLAGYFVAENKTDITALRVKLSTLLPEYMIPGFLLQMDKLPLNVNGKVDRRLLPHPGDAEIIYKGPRTVTEEKVMKIWQEILKRTEDIGIEDNFFNLGGHSIRLMQLFNRYYRVFGIKVTMPELFAHTTIAGQAALIEHKPAGIYEDIEAQPVAAGYPVSDGQRRIWILCQMAHAARSYHLGGRMPLKGSYVVHDLEQAIRFVIDRHEILRTVFRENEAGELQQVVMAEVLFKLPVVNAFEWEQEKIMQYLDDAAAQPFDLSKGPLIRVGLLHTAADEYILFYHLHHIISDGWSLGILSREIDAAYAAITAGGRPALLPLRIQYKDYAVWQQRQLSAGKTNGHRNYWLKQLSGELPVLQLPAPKVRPAIMSYNGNALSTCFSKSTKDGLRQLCRQEQVTLFMSLTAILNALFYRYTGQEDIILGSPVAGREHAEFENQIGFYVNTLVLRNRFKGEESFKALLAQVRETAVAAFEHQSYPFDRLVDELSVKRDVSRSVIFDVMIMLQNFRTETNPEQPVAGVIKDEGSCTVKFDLNFGFTESADGLYMRVEYNRDVYNREAVERMIRHISTLLDSFLENPELSLHQAVYMDSAEQQLLLNTFNDTAVDYDSGKTITDIFKENAARFATRNAVIDGDFRLTYRELDEESDKLAFFLQEAGVMPGELVPVCMERSAMLVIAILGIVKAGAAYVPVDPAYPQDRIRYMITDTGAGIILTQKKYNPLLNDFTDIRVVNVEESPEGNMREHLKSGKLAYVIYTSGSTGVPKGVMISHTSVVNLVQWHISRYDVNEESASTMMAGIGFDAGALELWSALLAGIPLHILPDVIKLDSYALMNYYNTHHITHAFVPTALVPELVATGVRVPSLRYILIGGDRLPYIDVSDLSYTLVNQYGPTESTVMVTDYPVTGVGYTVPPIGKPIANTRIYILDSYRNPVSIGVMGEIYIGGVQLATGYWNNPGLTAAQFVKSPFSDERLYKTGDAGKWLPDGNIEYCGRTDDQVKISGYRIEPGEITHVLRQIAGIREVVVNVFVGSEPQLVAYFEGDRSFTDHELRQLLTAMLPAYMIPAYFIQLEKLPLTANGKVDRKALPEPALRPATTGINIQPRNRTEEQMTVIVAGLLGRSSGDIGTTTNFFDLGATSITMIKMMNSFNRQFGWQLNVILLFRYPTIQALADHYSGIPSHQEIPLEEPVGEESGLDNMLSLFEEQ
ncbi:amino acid adenylation domain-containing protein [Chitinophaga oryziterrae]|uniref:Amino acid adenylation domain-containing protein n=1 Tax=Chitinophaga oryziterrae TaxID=1031224 RepID=A0A6N8JDQ5_9BACT|nr:non-ribosomal peptide synthetase [Chitinophaga oryziterrae]MVT42252.1 amino acid adenylation domain-containing protein [Chitinophaga oryziterrae]